MFSDILTPSKFYLSTMIGFLKNWTNKCLYGFQCNHWNMQVNHDIKIIETNFTFLIGFTDVIDNCVKSTDFKLKKNYCNIAVQCIFVHMYSVCQSNFDLICNNFTIQTSKEIKAKRYIFFKVLSKRCNPLKKNENVYNIRLPYSVFTSDFTITFEQTLSKSFDVKQLKNWN